MSFGTTPQRWSCEVCQVRREGSHLDLQAHVETVSHRLAMHLHLKSIAVGALATLRDYERRHNLTPVHVKGVVRP